MKVAIAVVRPFHAALMANTLLPHAQTVTILSSAPRRFFHGLAPEATLRLIPAPVQVIDRLLPFRLPRSTHRWDTAVWDRLVATLLPEADAFIGFATQSLASLGRARRRGARVLLDRACPHVDFQQAIIRQEADAAGSLYHPEPDWLRERQLEEYAAADIILTPSAYSANTFPDDLRGKVRIAPLLGRTTTAGPRPRTDGTFTVGVLGGNPLRKGYLYLLQAWKQLALPNARLLLRSSAPLADYPRIRELLAELPNVEIVRYIPHIADFYARCDVFCLPSVDDGFGMALCEAMAHGLPCLTTTNTGASELMTDGVDGLIVPPRAPERLAEALLRLYQSADLRHALGTAARATIARAATERLYENALLAAVER